MAIQIDEWAIVVAAKHHNPSLINPDFLKINGIIPKEWEVAGDAITTPPFTQIQFTNKISLTAMPEQIIFSEVIQDETKEQFKLPGIVVEFLKTLPHVSYQAIGINPRFFEKSNSKEHAQNFILDNLIKDGKWKNIKGNKPIAATKFTYPMKEGPLILDIQSATKAVDGEAAGILFAANFHRTLAGNAPKEKIKSAEHIINSYKEILNTFCSIIENSFLTGK